MLGIRVPDADEAMLISGSRASGDAPFRVVVGRRAFVVPLLSKVGFLSLAQQQAEISERCFSSEKIQLELEAVCAFKVPNDESMIIDAAQRFLSDQRRMPEQVGRITTGHLRGIAGQMTVEDIISKRQELADQVLDGSKGELARMGLQIDSFQIQSVSDLGQGYVEAMAAPHVAAIKRQATIAQAQARQAAAQAEQEAERNEASYKRETDMKTAEYTADVVAQQAAMSQRAQVAQAQAAAEIGRAQAEADQAAPLAKATASKKVAEAETALATQSALLRAQQLEAERVKPAEADALARLAQARAEAEATTLAAEAAASNDRVALEQRLIDLLPQITANVASSLQGAHLNIVNGTDGLGEIITGLVAQTRAIYDTARGAYSDTNGAPTSQEIRKR